MEWLSTAQDFLIYLSSTQLLHDFHLMLTLTKRKVIVFDLSIMLYYNIILYHILLLLHKDTSPSYFNNVKIPNKQTLKYLSVEKSVIFRVFELSVQNPKNIEN